MKRLAAAMLLSVAASAQVVATLTPQDRGATKALFGNVGSQTLYLLDLQNKGAATVKTNMAAVRRATSDKVMLQSRSASLLVLMRASENSWRNILTQVSGGLAYGASSLLGSGIIAASSSYRIALPLAVGFVQMAGGKIKDTVNPLAIDKFSNEACADRFEVASNDAVTCFVFAKRQKTEVPFTVEVK